MDTRAPTIEELLRMAREDVARNSLTTAEKTLEQAILINNLVPDAFYLLGYVYTKKGKFKKAILAFERTLSLDAFHTEAAIALSSLYNDVGKYREGAAVYQKTKQRLQRTLPGHDPQINQTLGQKHYEVGLLYTRFERFQEAYHEFTKALNLDPENPTYSLYMAKCLAKTGDKEGAIKVLRRVIESHPKNIEGRIQLGILYHSQQRLQDAHREWQEALSMAPDNKTAQMYLNMFEYEPPSRSA